MLPLLEEKSISINHIGSPWLVTRGEISRATSSYYQTNCMSFFQKKKTACLYATCHIPSYLYVCKFRLLCPYMLPPSQKCTCHIPRGRTFFNRGCRFRMPVSIVQFPMANILRRLSTKMAMNIDNLSECCYLGKCRVEGFGNDNLKYVNVKWRWFSVDAKYDWSVNPSLLEYCIQFRDI